MKLRTIFLILAFLFSSPGVCAEYTYRNPAHPNKSLTIDAGGSAFYLADAGVGAKFCDEGSKFYCVESRNFEFYVPKNLGVQKSWRGAKERYQVLGREWISVFGVSEEVVVIASTLDKVSVRYAYSEKRGLMIVSVGNEDGGVVSYLLQQACGFGGRCK